MSRPPTPALVLALTAAILAALTGCAGFSRAELEPPPYDPAPDRERLAAAGLGELVAWLAIQPEAATGVDPRAALERCDAQMAAAELELMSALRALDGDPSPAATQRVRAALAAWLDPDPAPLTLVGRDFAWHPAILRACAEAARASDQHDRAVDWLRELQARDEAHPDDLRRLAWSLAALERYRDAVEALDAIPDHLRLERDAATQELWRHAEHQGRPR